MSTTQYTIKAVLRDVTADANEKLRLPICAAPKSHVQLYSAASVHGGKIRLQAICTQEMMLLLAPSQESWMLPIQVLYQENDDVNFQKSVVILLLECLL